MLQLELLPQFLEQLTLPVLLTATPLVSQGLARRKQIRQWHRVQHLRVGHVVADSLAQQELGVVVLTKVPVLVWHIQRHDLVRGEPFGSQVVFVHRLAIEIIMWDSDIRTKFKCIR